MKSAAFQAFLVVLGVVLAFAANEWRERQARAAAAGAALDAIYREIEDNRRQVAESAAYNGRNLALIAGKRRSGEALALSDFPKGFVRYAQLADAAWTTAEQTGVFADMPYAEVIALSRVYAEQARYERQSEVGAAVIYEALFEDGYDAIVSGDARVETLIGSSWHLETELEKALAAKLAARR